jgi:protein TonB
MYEPVTNVLLQRAHDPGNVKRMYVFSMLAHGAVAAVILAAPGLLGPSVSQSGEKVVMSISLGGAPGPRSGGLTPMGGRPIQQVAPPATRPEPVRPPAARAPEMTLPSPSARKAPSRPPVRSAPSDATARKPTTGAEAQTGSAIAETGGRGMGFGLSTGGGGTGGYLDVGNFCCPEYLTTMLELIRRNWSSKQDVPGSSIVKFTIMRDGRLVAVELEKSSGYAALDLTAQRALLITKKLPPLPSAFTEPSLTVHLIFDYQR